MPNVSPDVLDFVALMAMGAALLAWIFWLDSQDAPDSDLLLTAETMARLRQTEQEPPAAPRWRAR